jgi:maleylacetoacetate isomerase
MMSGYILYDFPRSSASYRVRIALALKGIDYETRSVDLREGEQNASDYLAVSPAGLVPSLLLPNGIKLTQSLAIMRFLDTVAEPRLFPIDPLSDAHVSALALAIACDIHPLNNLRVLGYLQKELGVSGDAKSDWYAHWVRAGFAALELEISEQGGLYCFGDILSAADVCLVPQMANAKRLNVDLSDFPMLTKINDRLCTMPEFIEAAPPNL